MPIKLSKDGGAALDGSSPTQIALALAKQHAQLTVAAVAAMTDNGAGTDNGVVVLSAPVANAANAATNLAGKATSEAAAATVADALMELVAKTNEYSAALGLGSLTNNLGASAADGTIAAITKTVTAAATGIQATQANTYIAAVNVALNSIRAKVNACARALGYTEIGLTIPTNVVVANALTTLPALVTNALGTAADPGVTKAAFDAVLTAQANSIKALSVRLDSLTAARVPLVIVG